jgi:hypothetical protein
MKNPMRIGVILALALLVMSIEISHSATIMLDLDLSTPGIQTSRDVEQGSVIDFEVVFTGDGTTQFDTFALDIVSTNPAYASSLTPFHDPVAGAIADTAPRIALDIYSSDQVSGGSALAQGSMPTPLGYHEGLGGVGISSLGAQPFPLLEQGETIGLFGGQLTTAFELGENTLMVTGFPFGVGAGLNLAGASVSVDFQDAAITVVPLPSAVWLFTFGVLTLAGIRRRKGMQVFNRTDCQH